ncbi:MAG: efflux RND transporter periplasmic adaptor subunit [Pseudomonadota bacterium]
MNTRTVRKASLFAISGLAAAVAVAVGTGQIGYVQAEEPVQIEVPAGPTVTVALPTIRSITEWDEYTGRFEAVHNVEIRSRVSGYLTDIAFTGGDIVQEGDLLFRIDPRPFEAELASAEAALASADAALENAQSEATRGQSLLERRAISQEEADRRVRVLRQAEAQRESAKAEVTRAALNLEFTEVRAPVTGRVSDDFVSEGNLIVGGAAGGTLLSTVVSLDPIHFEFTASEAEYLKYVRLAQEGSRESGRDTAHPVRVKLMDEDSFDHDGYLSFVDNQLDRSTGTMRGRATLANPDGLLSPGMFGRLQLIASGEYSAVMIPDSAVQTDQGQKFVWTTGEDNTAHRQVVELGPIVDGLRIVRAGLEPTDRIIVSGTQFVQANAPIVPITDATQQVAAR